MKFTFASFDHALMFVGVVEFVGGLCAHDGAIVFVQPFGSSGSRFAVEWLDAQAERISAA